MRQHPTHFISWIVLVFLVSLIIVPQAAQGQVLTPPLSFQALESGTYSLPGIGPIELETGSFSDEQVAVAFETSYIGGDINQDGVRGDAAVVLTASTDSSEEHFFLLAVANDEGQPQQLGATYLGRGLQIDELLVQGADINVSYANLDLLRTSENFVIEAGELLPDIEQEGISPLPGIPVNQFIRFELNFDPATNAAIVDGYMPRGGQHNYQFDGAAGQPVRVDLYTRGSTNADLSFIVKDATTNLPLYSNDAQVTFAELTLPNSSRYEITIDGDAAADARYTLVVVRSPVEANTPSAPAPAQPTEPTNRLSINPVTGAVAAQGSIGASETNTYLLDLQAGQTIDVRLDIVGDVTVGTIGEPVLEVTDVQTGDVLLRANQLRQSTTLTTSQATTLSINVIASGRGASYSLSVTAEASILPSGTVPPPASPAPAAPPATTIGNPQPVDFLPGSSSVTFNGTLAANTLDFYELSGSEGQSVTVTTSGGAALGITGPGNILLLNPSSGVSSYTVTLPVSGSYTISVRASGAGTTNYSVTFTRSSTGNTYVIQPGETLLEIAIRFDTTIATLLTLNNLSDPNLIFAGQVLTLP